MLLVDNLSQEDVAQGAKNLSSFQVDKLFLECTIPTEKSTNTYKVSAFRLELEGRVATWIKLGLLPRKLLTFSSLPIGRSNKYRLQLKGIDEYSGGFVGAMCLGFLLERELNPDFDQVITNEFDRMMAVVMG
jgi:hypothetical protein